MSSIDVKEIILDPMQMIFMPPKEYGANNPENEVIKKALRGYSDVLKNFERDELHAAKAAVFESHDKKSWPLPSAFAIAAKRARAAKTASGSITGGARRFGEEDRKVRWTRWMEIRCSDLAADAVAAECSWSLKCMVLDHGKKADEIRLHELAADKQRAAAMALKIERREPIADLKNRLVVLTEPAHSVALMLWQGQLINEARTAEEIRRARLRVGVEPQSRGYLPGVESDELAGLL